VPKPLGGSALEPDDHIPYVIRGAYYVNDGEAQRGRKKNVKHLFSATKPEPDRELMLVDDIVDNLPFRAQAFCHKNRVFVESSG